MNLKGKDRSAQRFFEILPGATSWTILIGLLAVSFLKPVIAASFVIAFLLFWLYRLFYMTLFLMISYYRLAAEKTTDWMARVQGLDDLDHYLEGGWKDSEGGGLHRWVSRWRHHNNLRRLKRSGNRPPKSDEIIQLVIIPMAKELPGVVEPGVRSLAAGTFPADRIAVALALEARASQEVRDGAMAIAAQYRNRFYEFRVIVHPEGVPGEAKVKGANTTCAARAMAEFFKEKKVPLEHIIVSCFDADTVVAPSYFACLTYQYMVCPERERASFQPIPVYHNNIWRAPAFARILETGSSFFQLIEATNPEKLVTFSSHSMSFKALVEIGYWPVDMISDDSAIFWKAFVHFDGDYRVVPIYVTLSMDVVDSGSWWKTILFVYKQKRRWAWGVENFPIVMRAFLKSRKISAWDKIRHGFKLFEGHISWATWAFILSFVGWLPAFFAGREFENSVLYYTAPRITGLIFNLSALALIVSIIVSLYLLPKKSIRYPILRRILFGMQWLLLPVIFIFLSALPALDAQTRLMLGKHMEEFWVTEKKR